MKKIIIVFLILLPLLLSVGCSNKGNENYVFEFGKNYIFESDELEIKYEENVPSQKSIYLLVKKLQPFKQNSLKLVISREDDKNVISNSLLLVNGNKTALFSFQINNRGNYQFILYENDKIVYNRLVKVL